MEGAPRRHPPACARARREGEGKVGSATGIFLADTVRRALRPLRRGLLLPCLVRLRAARRGARRSQAERGGEDIAVGVGGWAPAMTPAAAGSPFSPVPVAASMDDTVEREAGRGHADFLERVVAMLREEGFTGRPDPRRPVVEFQHPEKLQVRVLPSRSCGRGRSPPCPQRHPPWPRGPRHAEGLRHGLRGPYSEVAVASGL